MAIARVTNSTATLTAFPTAATASHAINSGDILFLGTKGSLGYTTTVTYNGVAFDTRIADLQSDVGEYYLSLFVWKNPSTGTNTVSAIGVAGSTGFTAESYSGASQTTQPDVSNTGTASATTSLTVSATTVTDNAWMVGYFSSSANTLTASTGINFIIGQVNNIALGDSNSAITPTGSYSMTVTAGTGTFAGILAGIRPADVGGTLSTLMLMGVG